MIFDILFKNKGNARTRGAPAHCTARGMYGVVKIIGLTIQSGGFKSITRINPITTRKGTGRCWIDLPDEPETLRSVANALIQIAKAIDTRHRDRKDDPDAGLVGAMTSNDTEDKALAAHLKIDEKIGPPKKRQSNWT